MSGAGGDGPPDVHPAIIVAYHWPGGVRRIHRVFGPFDTSSELRVNTDRARLLYATTDIELHRLVPAPPDPEPPRRVGPEAGGG